jgi:putative inorganic carbon (hco3(-)) transporter
VEQPKIALLAQRILLLALLLFAVGGAVLPTINLKVDVTLFALLVLAVGVYGVLRSGRWIRQTCLDVPVGTFLSVAILSTVFSGDPFTSFFPSVSRGDGLLMYVVYAAMALIAARMDRTDASILLFAVLTGGALVSAIAVGQYYGWDITPWFGNRTPGDWFPRTPATLGNPILLGGYIILLLPIGLVLATGEVGRRWWRFAGGSVLLWAALLVSGTRSAWFACAGAVVLLVALLPAHSQTYRRLGFLALACGAAVAVLALTGPQMNLAQRMISALDPHDASLQDRLFIWKNTLPLIFQRPALGWGFSTLLGHFPGTGSAEYFHVFGTQLLGIDTPHNDLLYIAFSTGVAGLAAYLWVWATLLASLWPPNRTDRMGLTVGLLVSLVGYFLWLQLAWSHIGPANVFWALAGITVAQRRADQVTRTDRTDSTRVRFLLVELCVIVVALGLLTGLALPSYRASRQRVAFEEAVRMGEVSQALKQAAFAEARHVGAKWRTLAWSCLARTGATAMCASHRAIGFSDSVAHWQFTDPIGYATTSTSITLTVSAAPHDPLVGGETYVITLDTAEGTARDHFTP